MNYKLYYRIMLLVPIVAALLILGPEWAMPQRKDEFGIHLGLPLYFGVVPYCIFIALFVLVTMNKSPQDFMRNVWLSPLMLAPFALASWLIMDYDKAANLNSNLDLWGLLIVAGAVTIFGFVYISVIVVLCKLLSHIGCVKIPEIFKA